MSCYDSLATDLCKGVFDQILLKNDWKLFIFIKKHYIFHCTNPKLVEIRKTFIPEIYETFTRYPDVNSNDADILHIILRGSPYTNYNRIGKFLSLVLVKTQDLSMEVDKDKGPTSQN